MTSFQDVFTRPKPLIGVCHLPPLPDYPDSPGIDALRAHALADLRALEAAGFDAMLVENEYDRPHRVRAQPETRAAMLDITTAVRDATERLVVGCEVLLHDPRASLDIANSSALGFVRTDYFIDRMSRANYGEFEIDPDGLLDYRADIGADGVLILADIQVKFATMIDKRPLQESARLAALNRADAVVVTGDETGEAPSVRCLREARAGIGASGLDVPLLLGSGLQSGNALELMSECDGAIIGTALMRGGRIDVDQARRLAEQVAELR